LAELSGLDYVIIAAPASLFLALIGVLTYGHVRRRRGRRPTERSH
jgi:hypothetical protein